MRYKKSHRDQNTTPQVITAIKNECNILEVDFIYLYGDLVCSHSWRPFKCLCHGTLSSYIEKLDYLLEMPSLWNIENLEKPLLYIQLDFKTVNKKADETLLKIILRYQNKPVSFLLSGGSFMKRDKRAIDFYNKNKDKLKNIQLYDEWKIGKEIETVDLFISDWNNF